MLIHLMFVFLNWNYHPCERFCLAMGCLMMFVRLHSCKPSFHISACHFCFHHRIPVSPWLKMSCTCHAFRSYVALLDLVVLWATLPSLSLKKSSKHILPCQTFRSGPQSFPEGSLSWRSQALGSWASQSTKSRLWLQPHHTKICQDVSQPHSPFVACNPLFPLLRSELGVPLPQHFTGFPISHVDATFYIILRGCLEGPNIVHAFL